MVCSLVEVKSAVVCNGMSQHASLQHVHWGDHLKDKREEECLARDSIFGKTSSSSHEGDSQWKDAETSHSEENFQILSEHF